MESGSEGAGHFTRRACIDADITFGTQQAQ
jgi:hypothetical protein